MFLFPKFVHIFPKMFRNFKRYSLFKNLFTFSKKVQEFQKMFSFSKFCSQFQKMFLIFLFVCFLSFSISFSSLFLKINSKYSNFVRILIKFSVIRKMFSKSKICSHYTKKFKTFKIKKMYRISIFFFTYSKKITLPHLLRIFSKLFSLSKFVLKIQKKFVLYKIVHASKFVRDFSKLFSVSKVVLKIQRMFVL